MPDIVKDTIAILTEKPGWYGRALIPGAPSDVEPAAGEAIELRLLKVPIEGMTPVELAECVRNARALWLSTYLYERANQPNPDEPEIDWIKLSDVEREATWKQADKERKARIAAKDRGAINVMTCYCYFGVAVAADVCAQLTQHGFEPGALALHTTHWWKSTDIDERMTREAALLKALKGAFDIRFVEPAFDDTGKLARLFNKVDGYGYSTIPDNRTYATTIGRTPDRTQLGVHRAHFDRDETHLIVHDSFVLTDLRCFALGTTT